MKCFVRVLAATVLAWLSIPAQAQVPPDAAAEALARLSRTITLADLPDVAECRGVTLPPEAIDRVNAATEDPHETFERWRMEHRSMVEESPGIECQSKLWRRRHGFSSGATVPAGTEGLTLRSGDEAAEAFLRTLGLRPDAASVGANVLPAGGVENYQGEMQIAVNPNNPQQLVAGANHFYADPNCTRPGGGSTNGTQAFYGSTNGGATWVYRCAPWPSDISGSVSGAAFFFGSDPALAWDSQNRAYAAYMLLNCNSSQTSCGYSIVVARSTDVGQTWTPWGTVVNHSGDNTHGDDKEMIAVDNSPGPASTKSHPGRVYVIWDDLNVERVAYTDNGTSWTTVVLPNGTNAIGGNVVVGRDGTVYVIWNRLTDPEAIVFSRSVDGGSTWSTPITVATSALLSFGTNNNPPAQESRKINAFGSIGIDNNPASPFFGNLYVVYNDFPTGTSTGTNVNVYLVTSSNGGTSWSSRVLVNDDAATGTQFFPWLSVDQSDGTVNVSWYDTRLDPANHRKTQIFYARSSNGGVSLEPNILVTDNGGVVWRNGVNYSDENTTDNASRNGNQYGDYAGIVATNRKVVPFWMDSRNFFPSADTVSPTRREDAAAATIINCSAPAGLSAPSVTTACGAPRVQLTWSAPSWGTNATSGTYSVYRSTTSSFANAILLAPNLNTTSYDDSTGLPTVTYYYFIVVKNNCPGTTLTPMSTTSAASAAIAFPACGAQVGNLQGSVTVGGSPVSGATVTASPYSTTTDGSGNYFLGPIPAGTYTVTAAATGYNTGTANGVVIANGLTTTQNFTLTAATASACFTDTTQVQFEAGTLTTLDSTTSPGDLRLPLTFPEGVDQHADDNGFGSGYGFSNTSFIGQTFTPGVTAQLTKVDTQLFCAGCSGANPNLTLELRTTSGGQPVMTVGGLLASSTISGFASSSSTLKTFVFSSPVTLTSGTQYGIVIKLAAARTGTQAWAASNGDVMAGGRRVSCTSSCSNPSGMNSNSDLIFAAYMKSTTYQTAGNLVSTVKDSAPVTGASTSWTTLSWTATTPASTTVRFQAAGSNSVAGPFSFVGPDGTAATFFTVSGASLSQFNANRYLKYKAYLSTTLNTSTPALSDVTVCDSVSDCSAAAAPAITPSPATVCASSTGNTASSSAASTYSWSITNGTITGGAGSQTVTYTAGAFGSVGLTVNIVTAAGCPGTSSISVPITPTPATPTASNGGPYCGGATISLSTPTVSGATYSWTGPNGFTSSLQNPTRANATTSDAGTYSVTVTVNGCTSAAGTTNVVVNATPSTPTASNGGPYCEGATIALSTPTVSGATYSWTGPNGFTSSLQNPTRVNATTSDADTYSVTITVNGCTSAAGTTNVVVNATPATPAASNGGPHCEVATIALSTPTVSGATYSWTGPNGFTTSLQNPTRANATTSDAGTYSVTVTVNGCTSAAGTTNVVVNATPATPTASNGGPYCEGSTIALSTPTVSGAAYSWTGPNGFTSSLQNPTRSSTTTADAGTYSVTVTVNGCTSAAGTTNVVVNATPATPTASNGGPYCEGATISLSTPTVSGATYSWTGPNGFTSSLQNPTRANATTFDAGTYSVTVMVNGCTSAAGTTNVVVNATPATPTASNGGPYCEGATIALSTPTVSGATYSWTGPNGFTSAAQNPTRSNATLADAGTYSVTVTVNGCTSAAGTTNVVVNATPATPTASNGGPYCEGAAISLSTPTVSGATYSWTGPNGFTSSLQNPTRANATTSDAGTYSITVTVNGCTSAAGTTNVVVNATPATPTASNGGPYCEGSTIWLSTPTVSGATYSWTGPNGFTSSLQNPTRANATTPDAGTYSVSITVNGCTSAAGTTNVVVNATPATPTASNGGPYCESATIALSTATVSGATYSWTGPNGFTSSLQNPTRSSATLADAGTYSVTVTVNGCTSAAGTTNVVVNATPATPTASNGGPYCEGATISLSTPTVSGATYSWTGPNGFTSSLQNPTRSSATTADAGIYSVTITVNGCTSAAGTTSVVVNANPPTPTISPAGSIVFCYRDPVTLTSSSATGNQWYVFDTPLAGETGQTLLVTRELIAAHSQNFAAYFSVAVTLGGCSSSSAPKLVEVLTPGTPVISAAGPTTFCTGGSVELSSNNEGSTGQWYRDGNEITGATTTSYVALTSGSYTFVDRFYASCPSDPSNAIVVTVNPIPATPAAANGGPYCEGATIALSTPNVSGATFSWTGPNGFTSSAQNPTRSNATLLDAGTYSVTVTVDGCTSAAGTTNVVVNAAPATPTASNGGPYCEGATISLSTPTVSGATYSWTGPNGFTSSAQNPTRINATTVDAGTYSVTITVNGCTSAAGTTNVIVNATPSTPTASNGGPYCEGATIALSTPTVIGATYSWTGPNGFTSSQQNPTRSNATPADAGNYSVTVTVNGCTSAAGTTNVVVNATPATPTITPGGSTTFCAGGSVLLTSNSATGNQWYLDGNPIAGATAQTFNATASGNYTIVGTNVCSSAPSAATTVIVNPIPATPAITPGGPTTFCEGGSVLLTSSSSSGYQWYRNGSQISGETAQTILATIGGVYTVIVTNSGCSSNASAGIAVTVNPKPDFTIGVASPMFAGSSSVASVNIGCAGMTFSWSISGGTITSGNGSPRVTFIAAGAGTLTLMVTVTNSFGCSATRSVDVTVQQASFGAPPFLDASTSGTTSASLRWAAVASADHYEVYRSTDNINWSLRGTPSGTTFSESGLMLSTTYLYKVRAIKADSTASAYSAINAATTIALTDDPLTVCGPIIKAVHITQLRTAINTVRASVGLSAFSFTDPLLAAGNAIKAVHLSELRTALSGFLSAIGVTPSYTDPTITAGVVTLKAAHIQELRDLVD
jgi:hypothetical protein